MTLCALLVNAAHVGGQKVSVNIWPKAEAAISLGCSLQQFLCRLCPHLREGGRAQRLGKLRTRLFSFSHWLGVHSRPLPAGEECAAFSDGFLKKIARQRRSHQRTDRKRSSGLTGDSDVVGISSESRDVLHYPAQSRYLVQKAIVARGVVA